MSDNPVLNFEIDKSALKYIGQDLQRPECILAERDGTLWSADARGGVVQLKPDGSQKIVIQGMSGFFSNAGSEADAVPGRHFAERSCVREERRLPDLELRH